MNKIPKPGMKIMKNQPNSTKDQSKRSEMKKNSLTAGKNEASAGQNETPKLNNEIGHKNINTSLMTKNQRFAKSEEIKMNKLQKVGINTNKEMKIIEEKLLKTEITPGLQQDLDIKFAKIGNEWKEEWDTNEESNIIGIVAKTILKPNKTSKSVKRKFEDEDEYEIVHKILKFEDKSQIMNSENQAKLSHQNSQNITQAQTKTHLKSVPNLSSSKSNLFSTQKQNLRDIKVEVEEKIEVSVEKSTNNSNLQGSQAQISVPGSSN